MLHRQADIIQSVQQTMLAEGLYFKQINCSIRGGNFLLRQIYLQTEAAGFSLSLEQRINDSRIQTNRQQAVLEAVIEKNIGITGCNYHAKTIVFQCPRRMLTRRTAAKIFTGQQNLCALVTRLVQHKIRIELALAVVHTRLAVIQIAPLVKSIRTKTRTFDRLQKLLRYDRIRIDVGSVKWHYQSIQ